jgi:hypothetical protein
MTWTKLDDGFWMHPKIVHAGNEAVGVFARLLSYCGNYLTDGTVPGAVALYIAGGQAELLEKLERADLIRLTPETGFVEIPDWHDYNPSKAEAKARAEARSEAGRRGGQSAAARRRAA